MAHFSSIFNIFIFFFVIIILIINIKSIIYKYMCKNHVKKGATKTKLFLIIFSYADAGEK